LVVATAIPAVAQMREEVQFAPGNFGAMVGGSITGQDYFDHVLRANAGQEMFVELIVNNTDGNGTIYFNILPPGATGEAIYNGSLDGNTARITLPESGAYTIRTYLMGNDEDTGKTVAYNLDLSIQ
jgi:hypothetical protein